MNEDDGPPVNAHQAAGDVGEGGGGEEDVALGLTDPFVWLGQCSAHFAMNWEFI